MVVVVLAKGGQRVRFDLYIALIEYSSQVDKHVVDTDSLCTRPTNYVSWHLHIARFAIDYTSCSISMMSLGRAQRAAFSRPRSGAPCIQHKIHTHALY